MMLDNKIKIKMYTKQCCETMSYHLAEGLIKKYTSICYGIPIMDGGDSYIQIFFCPWCGKEVEKLNKCQKKSVILKSNIEFLDMSTDDLNIKQVLKNRQTKFLFAFLNNTNKRIINIACGILLERNVSSECLINAIAQKKVTSIYGKTSLLNLLSMRLLPVEYLPIIAKMLYTSNKNLMRSAFTCVTNCFKDNKEVEQMLKAWRDDYCPHNSTGYQLANNYLASSYGAKTHP